MGAYLFPADVMVSVNYRHTSGDAFARQVLFRGGETVPSIVLHVEPIGTHSRSIMPPRILELSLGYQF
ncbi:MAG: hypothetical protein A3F70_18840 [Acidobacteria bacterium RIFCSPLOWO2_12_FULL_67_14]|nr:MAG: hypothetical protein A3H29_03570 [Acidobacteria bacterium RIFCSPLOWO2_02_FULL_67_21]OFW35708.1 MAG: hypothetical protein A3F70_18840 [Acidobacteria bacterium RIFCSPLOWO2_12_FULL_67_14]